MLKRIGSFAIYLLLCFTISACAPTEMPPSAAPMETLTLPKFVPSATPLTALSGFSGQLVYVMDSQLFINDLKSSEINLVENATSYLQYPSAGAYLSISPSKKHIAFYGVDPLYGCPTYHTDQSCVLTGPDGYFLVDVKTEEVSLIAPYVITNITWAPTEDRFAFSTVDFEKIPYQTVLKISSPAGGEPFIVAAGEFVDTHPSWSPTGEWIAFYREPSPLPNQPKCESESVVYNSCVDPDLYIIHPDGSGLTLIERHARILNSMYNTPSWSPDGKRLIVVTGPQAEELTIIDISTGERTKLVDLYPVVQPPLWSRDGNSLLLTSQLTGSRDILKVNLDGSILVNLSNHNAPDYYPAWSPDETAVAFISQRSSVRRTLVIQSLVDPDQQVEFKDINTRFLPLWVEGLDQ